MHSKDASRAPILETLSLWWHNLLKEWLGGALTSWCKGRDTIEAHCIIDKIPKTGRQVLAVQLASEESKAALTSMIGHTALHITDNTKHACSCSSAIKRPVHQLFMQHFYIAHQADNGRLDKGLHAAFFIAHFILCGLLYALHCKLTLPPCKRTQCKLFSHKECYWAQGGSR